MRIGIVARGFAAAAATCVSLALLVPANAQLWGDSWGNRQPQQRQPQQQNNWNSNWGWGWGHRQDNPPRPQQTIPHREYREPHQYQYQREVPVDYSRAPAATPRKDATTPIVVMGDAMADWLAYGLEDAVSEKPEFGIVRKHRTESGLIRYDHRRDIEWPAVAREIIAAEKPKFIVMMIGNHDRQAIREKPPAARPNAPKPNTPAAPQAQPATPAQPAPAKTEQQDAELQTPEAQENPEPAPPPPTTEQGRLAAYGPWEFRSEKWELAYIKRVDATIAALKSAGVPVFWVGLPAQRGSKSTQDAQYLNEIYKSRAEKAGIVYVDIWDGFVDEAGRFSAMGPDYEGQIRRLRTGDGVYFTKYGARKLAHYVEREIQRSVVNRAVPVALPSVGPGPQTPSTKPTGRPAVGPVVPLTTTTVGHEELLGGRAPARAPAADPTATRVLTKGEAITAPIGRGDDFSWPPKTPVNVDPSALEATPPTPAVAAPAKAETSGPATADPRPKSHEPAPKRQRTTTAPRPPSNTPSGFFQNLFR
jgi:hypothetical protein